MAGERAGTRRGEPIRCLTGEPSCLVVERPELLSIKERLLEVALMPHALQRVYVHRVARAAAGGAALLGAAAIMVGVLDPWTGRVLMMLSGMPRS